MNDEKKADKKIIYYIISGAALGAIAGYIVNKVGIKNIIDAMKAKEIIPEKIADTISEFTSEEHEEQFEDEE